MFSNQVNEFSLKLSHVLGEIPCGASEFDTAQRFSFVGIAGCFGVPFSISGSGAGLESMAAAECKALATRADPLKVRLEAEEILSGFEEAAITWPPVPLLPAASSATHTRVCFANRIFYRHSSSTSVVCNEYSSPAVKSSHANASHPVVITPPPSNPCLLPSRHSPSYPSRQICSFEITTPPPPSSIKNSLDAAHRSIPSSHRN
jgi:hypothetical protein